MIISQLKIYRINNSKTTITATTVIIKVTVTSYKKLVREYFVCNDSRQKIDNLVSSLQVTYNPIINQ